MFLKEHGRPGDKWRTHMSKRKSPTQPSKYLNTYVKRFKKERKNSLQTQTLSRRKTMKELKFTASIVLLLLFLGGNFLHADASITELINSDLKTGKINLNEAIIYKVYALRTPWALPKKYQQEVPIRDGTPIILEVWKELGKAHPDVREYVKYMFAPRKIREKMTVPTLDTIKLPNKSIALKCINYEKEKAKEKRESYITPDGHFIIYYYKKGSESVDISYVEQVGQYLEESWEYAINFLDYSEPKLGDNNRVDVYIIDLTGGVFGISHPPVIGNDGYLEFDIDYSWAPSNDDPDGNAIGALKSTTAHECIHQIQYRYLNFIDKLFDGWWMESSATFMMDIVFDSPNLYKLFLGGFYGSTHISIDEIPGGGYQTFLINLFLIERYSYGDPKIIKEILEGINLITSAEESISKALKKRGHNLATCFQDFALWNFFTGIRHRKGYYEEGGDFPTFNNFQNTHTIGNSSQSITEQNGEVDNLAANYYQIVPDSELTTAKTLEIQVARNSENVLGRIVVMKKDGSIDLKWLYFNSDNKAKVQIKNFSSLNTTEVVLILSNGSEHFTKKISYSAKLVTGLDLIFVIDTTGSMWDDIANVKASSTEIVNHIDSELPDYRIAVVDYRDFPVSPYGASGDYPYKVRLSFSTDKTSIINAIQSLSLGNGADWQESVYTALVKSFQTDGLTPWRSEANKAIILLGDAPPHDPEPFTGYTIDSVISAANSIFSTSSSLSTTIVRPISQANENQSSVSIYGIAIGYDPSAYNYFKILSEKTGGKVFKAPTASDIVEKIIEVIGEIEDPEENHSPICDAAVASISQLWPPNHKMKAIKILNVIDPDGDPVYIKITDITQDEPVSGFGKGDKSPDGQGVGTDTAWLRAERYGKDDSRVYKISFIAYDDKGAQGSGSIFVCVPHDQGLNTACNDDGQAYDSTISK